MDGYQIDLDLFVEAIAEFFEVCDDGEVWTPDRIANLARREDQLERLIATFVPLLEMFVRPENLRVITAAGGRRVSHLIHAFAELVREQESRIGSATGSSGL